MSNDFGPEMNDSIGYDDRNYILDEDAPPEGGYVIDEDLSRNIGYSDPDPAEEPIEPRATFDPRE